MIVQNALSVSRYIKYALAQLSIHHIAGGASENAWLVCMRLWVWLSMLLVRVLRVARSIIFSHERDTNGF